MTSHEVAQLTGIDGFYPTNEPKDCVLIGTALTYKNGVPIYTESFAMEVNNRNVEVSMEEVDSCIRHAYANIVASLANRSGGDLGSLPFDAVYYHYLDMFEGNTKIGNMRSTSYLYSYGKLPVNGKRMYVYDVKTSFILDPVDNRCVKSLGLAIGCGYNSDVHRFIDASVIDTSEISETNELNAQYTLGEGLSFGGTLGWSHGAHAFRCTNDLSNPTSVKWTVTPKKPENNETWKMQPGVRFVSEFSTTDIEVGFKGTLYSTFFLKPHPVCSFLRIFNNVKLKDK